MKRVARGIWVLLSPALACGPAPRTEPPVVVAVAPVDRRAPDLPPVTSAEPSASSRPSASAPDEPPPNEEPPTQAAPPVPLRCGKETCTTAQAPFCIYEDKRFHCGGPGQPFFRCFSHRDCGSTDEECCSGNLGTVSTCLPRGQCTPEHGFDPLCKTTKDCALLTPSGGPKQVCRTGEVPGVRWCGPPP